MSSKTEAVTLPAGTIPPTPTRLGGTLTAQAAATAIDSACRYLLLPSIRATWHEAIAQAERDHTPYAGFLAELLLNEVDARKNRAAERRIKEAGFPRIKLLTQFDRQANENINPATLAALASCDWVRRGDPLCLIGDSGTGKSHLLIALGMLAAEQGFKVRYTLATRLANELAEAQDEKNLTRTINKYGRVDLLLIDEFGYMELDRTGAELLYQVLTEREEKKSVAIASNQPFSEWINTFTDPRLCAAIVDRLTYNGTIIETGTNSYRLAQSKKGTKTGAKPQ